MSNDNVTCKICDEQWDRRGLMQGEIPAWKVDLLLAGNGCPCCESECSEFIKPEPLRTAECKSCGRPFEIDQDEIFYRDSELVIPDHQFVDGMCEQCIDVLTVECYVCEKRIMIEHSIESTGDRFYCKRCYDRNVVKCISCSCDVGPGQAYHEAVCMDCGPHYEVCRGCKQVYSKDVVHNRLCEKCHDDLL